MKIKSLGLVGVIMGSKSDWKTMIHCSNTLKKFGVKHEVKVISAHRTPDRLHKFLNEAIHNSLCSMLDSNPKRSYALLERK